MNALTLRTSAHTLTKQRYSDALMALLTAAPAITFAKLTAPSLHYYAPAYGSSGRYVIRVHKTTPAGRKIVASIIRSPSDLTPQPFDLFAGSYTGHFYPISEDDLALLVATHRDLVAAAVTAGLSCPLAVRCEYPDLFVTLPPGCEARDVSDALTCWGRDKIATPADIARVIESVQESIRHHDRHANLWATTALTTTQADQDEARNSLLNRLDFYRWLETHVRPGGVFAAETKAEEAA